MPAEHDLTRILVYLGAAVGYAVSGYMTKVSRHEHVEFDLKRFGTTLVIGVVAGLVMAAQGDEVTPEAYAAAAAIAIPIADKVVNTILHADETVDLSGDR